jgi:predicted aminopeptidase
MREYWLLPLMKTDNSPMRLIIVLVVLLSSGCADLGYYWHSAKGHMEVMNRRVAIKDLLRDPQTDTELKQRLTLVREIREFAFNRLRLPESGSYSDYAQLDNPYVLQNLFAAPEFSTQLLSWCYPVAGCTSYRGFYEQQRLDAFVAGLKADKNEVHISRVPAYSTLGWFDDPVLSSFINWPDHRLAGLLFHELTHQRIYIDGDSRFNESLASAVQLVGIRLWLEYKNQPLLLEKYNRGLVYRRDVAQLIESARDQLEKIYKNGETDDWKRQQKQKIFQLMRDQYEDISRRHNYRDGYAKWVAADLNNAKLGSVSTYNALIPAFVSMITALDNDFERFYRYAEKLGESDKEKRDLCLQAWRVGNALNHNACL